MTNGHQQVCTLISREQLTNIIFLLILFVVDQITLHQVISYRHQVTKSREFRTLRRASKTSLLDRKVETSNWMLFWWTGVKESNFSFILNTRSLVVTTLISGDSGKSQASKSTKKRKKPQHPNNYPSGKFPLCNGACCCCLSGWNAI